MIKWDNAYNAYIATGDPTQLAKIIAYSVLRKCINVSYNATLIQMRNGIKHDSTVLDGTAYASANAYAAGYTADGDYKRETVNPDAAAALDCNVRETIGDGYDYVQVAALAILDATAAQQLRDPEQPVDLQRPYTVRRLRRRVWIKHTESADTPPDAWETVETTPVQDIYRAVRRYVQQSRAAQTDPRNGYTYLQDMAVDAETGDADTIYRRLPKYADLGGNVTDYNGATTAYTADNTTVDCYYDLLDRLNPTVKQRKVLQLRLQGYGYKAIATYLGVSADSVRHACTELQRKARARFPADMLPD